MRRPYLRALIAVVLASSTILLTVFVNEYSYCRSFKVPFVTKRIDSADRAKGTEAITTKGVLGTRRDCRSLVGKVVSNVTTTQPTTEIITVGTYEPPPAPETPYVPPTYTPSYRTGAICGDGSYSPATGRGACSWHGGVSEWLYE